MVSKVTFFINIKTPSFFQRMEFSEQLHIPAFRRKGAGNKKAKKYYNYLQEKMSERGRGEVRQKRQSPFY
jgi:hypothetical protein